MKTRTELAKEIATMNNQIKELQRKLDNAIIDFADADNEPNANCQTEITLARPPYERNPLIAKVISICGNRPEIIVSNNEYELKIILLAAILYENPVTNGEPRKEATAEAIASMFKELRNINTKY